MSLLQIITYYMLLKIILYTAILGIGFILGYIAGNTTK